MYRDMFGKNRIKLGLHLHTTLSDGNRDPVEVAALYRNAGYDAVALTDHWLFGEQQMLAGIPVLSGAEYHVGEGDSMGGVYHILCLFAKKEPFLHKSMTVQQIIDGIHDAGGLAVLAHPAWSLDTPEMILALKGIDATEIYNTVSDRGHSRRGDSSLIVDMIASRGCRLPLLATDDAHYYGEGNEDDLCHSFIMLEGDEVEPSAIRTAIKEGRFYASEGPEIHLCRKGDTFSVDCSPASEIVFFSNFVYSHRVRVGKNLTHAEYTPKEGETYIRAFVTDRDGKRAWSNIIAV